MSANEQRYKTFSYDQYPISIVNLLKKYPNTPVVKVEQILAESDFEDQKRRKENQIEIGAIGIITTDDGRCILTKRTKPHPGWALPGGGVEEGEMVDNAFIREMLEECGVKISIIDLVLIEDKTLISPKQVALQFWLVVFKGRASSNQVPFQTEIATQEGLEIATFSIEELPKEMILKDREKLIDYY